MDDQELDEPTEATTERHQVVVGVDGSRNACTALWWGVVLARMLHDDVTPVHGQGVVSATAGAGPVPARRHLASLGSVVATAWWPESAAALPRDVEVDERPAVDALLAAADRRPTDLVVVGTRGLALGPLEAIGSTALRLLQRATVPVLVVPDQPEAGQASVRRLLVAYDGSPAAQAALLWAAALASRIAAACEVLAVAEDEPVFPLGPAATVTAAGEERATAWLRRDTERACEPLRALGVPYEVTVRRGSPAQAVLAVADEHRADMLVVGSSGRGSPDSPLTGSVSRRVAHDAGRPVAVVPSAARNPWAPTPESRDAAHLW